MQSRKIRAAEYQIMAYRSPRETSLQLQAAAMQRLWNPVSGHLVVRHRVPLRQMVLQEIRHK